MKWGFPYRKKETPASLRQKAEEIIMQVLSMTPKATSSLRAGEHNLNRKGETGEFRQFKDYHSDDRPQDIDWKRSARSDQIFVREREMRNSLPLKIFISPGISLDFRSSNSLPTKYEACAILALAFSLEVEKTHDPIQFNGYSIQADDLGHFLLATPLQPAVLKETSSSDIAVIIGDFLEGDIDSDIFHLVAKSRRVVLLHCYDPAERSLPFKGRISFSHAHNISVTINDVVAIRDAYLEHITEHQAKLRNFAETRGWFYRIFDTSEALGPVFMEAKLYLGDSR